jgi:hypothetical protein
MLPFLPRLLGRCRLGIFGRFPAADFRCPDFLDALVGFGVELIRLAGDF